MSCDGQTATAVGNSHMVDLNTGMGRGSAHASFGWSFSSFAYR